MKLKSDHKKQQAPSKDGAFLLYDITVIFRLRFYKKLILAGNKGRE